MNVLFEFLKSPFAERIGWVLIHFIWQGLAIGTAAGIARVLLRPASSNVRYLAMCLSVFLCAAAPVCTLPFVHVASPSPIQFIGQRPEAQPAATLGIQDGTSPQPAAEDAHSSASRILPLRSKLEGQWHNVQAHLLPVLPWLVAAWVLGIMVMSSRMICGVMGLRTLKQTALLLDPELSARFEAIKARLGVITCKLVIVTGIDSPCVIGWLKPAILFPVSSLSNLGPAEIEAILAHELAHVRRHDYLVNLIQSVIQVMLFFHPCVWLINYWIRIEREHCCDDTAVRIAGDSRAYALALTKLETTRHAFPEFAPAANSGSLLNRIRRLVAPPGAGGVSGQGISGALALLLAIVAGFSMYRSLAENESPASAPYRTFTNIHGRVLDQSGKPVSGAKVWLYYTAPFGKDSRSLETGTTDQSGQYAFASAAVLEKRFSIDDDHAYVIAAKGADSSFGWHVLNGSSAPEGPRDVQFEAMHECKVSVVDDKQKPIPGAAVWLYRAWKAGAETRFVAESDIGICSTQTGSDGIATLPLPNCETQLRATCRGWDYTYSASYGARTETIKMGMRPAGTISGVVRDERGHPLSNVWVWVEPNWKFYQYWWCRSDEAGRFVFDDLWSKGEKGSPAEYQIGVDAQTHAAMPQTVRVGPNEHVDNVVLTAGPGVLIKGRLLEPVTQHPIEGGKVLIRGTNADLTVVTDRDGKFSARILPGRLYVSFHSGPDGTWVDETNREVPSSHLDREFVDGPTFSCEIMSPSRLGKFVSVSGKVTIPEGISLPEGISPAEIEVASVVTGPELIRPYGIPRSKRFAKPTQDGVVQFPSIPAGIPHTFLARTRDNQYFGISEPTTAGKDIQSAFQIPLQRTGTCRLRLVDENGAPRKKQSLTILPELRNRFACPFWDRQVVTDDSGRVSVDGIAKGIPYVVGLADGDHTSCKLVLLKDDETAPEEMVLPLSERFWVKPVDSSGRILDVQRIPQLLAEYVDGERNSHWSNGPVPILKRDPEKGYLVERDKFVLAKTEAPIAVTCTLKDGRTVELSGTYSDRDSTLSLAEKPDPTAVSGMQPNPTGPIVGVTDVAFQVKGDRGEPVEAAQLELYGGEWSWGPEHPYVTYSGKDGIIWLPGFGKTSIHYAAVKKPGLATVWLTSLPAGKRFSVTLSERTRLKGAFRSSENSAPGKTKVLLLTDRKRMDETDSFPVKGLRVEFETDDQGRYDQPVAPGKYRLQAESGQGEYAVGEFEVTENQSTAIPIKLEKGLTVRMQCLELGSEKPLAGIRVSIEKELGPAFVGRVEGSDRISGTDGYLEWVNLPPGHVTFLSDDRFPGYGEKDNGGYVRWWSPANLNRFRPIPLEGKKPFGRDGFDDITVDVKHGMEPVTVYMEKGVLVRGVVLGPDEQPVTRTELSYTSDDNAQLVSGDSRNNIPVNSDGKFAAWLPAGNGLKYHLIALQSAYNGELASFAPVLSESFDSNPGDVREFKLKLTRGGWLTGRMLDENGKPLAKAYLMARAEDRMENSRPVNAFLTDDSGRFRVGPLRQTLYKLGVYANGRERWAKSPASGQQPLVKTDTAVDLGDLRLEATEN